jgi:aldose sugar dehydrogenase
MLLSRYASAGSGAPDRPESEHDNTRSQNVIGGAGANGRGGILRFTQDGKPVEDKFNSDSEYPVHLYYAYGIRNSFGMDFDPVSGATGKDEINFIKAWF